MNGKKIYQQVTGAMFILLLLVGCGAPAAEPTPEPPLATPTPEQPKATPTTEPPTATPPVLITSAETLIGNWQPLKKSKDAMFLQINSDGTCGQSFLLETLADFPQVECTYTFEGTNFLITAVKLNGVPACPSPTGKYEIRLLAEDQIEIVLVEDTCGHRVRSTLGVYHRIP
jgi:hypothetical protein